MVKADREEQANLLKSRESFMVWQSIPRGVGVYSGYTRCVHVCPVGRDYEEHLHDAQDTILERAPEKEIRLSEMARRRSAGERGPYWGHSSRWIEGPAGSGP